MSFKWLSTLRNLPLYEKAIHFTDIKTTVFFVSSVAENSILEWMNTVPKWINKLIYIKLVKSILRAEGHSTVILTHIRTIIGTPFQIVLFIYLFAYFINVNVS